MNLSIQFNWPTGEDSASVHFGQPNINDKETRFRIGVIPKDKVDKIAWHNSGWVLGDTNLETIVFRVMRGDKVVVERKHDNTEKVDTRNTWDIDEEWPDEAQGPATTFVPWYF